MDATRAEKRITKKRTAGLQTRIISSNKKQKIFMDNVVNVEETQDKTEVCEMTAKTVNSTSQQAPGSSSSSNFNATTRHMGHTCKHGTCVDSDVKSDENLFTTCVVLNKPTVVNLLDGRPLRATKLGKVLTYVKTDKTVHPVELRNVYFVQGLEKNILSFS